MATSRSRAWPQSTITVGGRSSCTPESSRATRSSGRWVAESPMRWSRPPLSVDQRVEALEAEREVAAPLVAGQRVHLVDDHRAHAAQQRPRRRRGEEQVERLGRGDEQVGRLLPHGGPLGRRGVAGAHGDAQAGVGVAEARRLLPDLRQRHVEVLVHVDGEGAQRRDVEDLGRARRARARPRRPGRRRRWPRGSRSGSCPSRWARRPARRCRRRCGARPRVWGGVGPGREAAGEPARHGRVERAASGERRRAPSYSTRMLRRPRHRGPPRRLRRAAGGGPSRRSSAAGPGRARPARTLARCRSISSAVAMPCAEQLVADQGDGGHLEGVAGRVAHREGGVGRHARPGRPARRRRGSERP